MTTDTYRFCGRDIETLSRDELLEAYRRLSDELHRERAWAIQAATVDAELAQARDGLKGLARRIMTGSDT